MLGFSYDGSRRADFVASIENIRVAPVGGEDATLWTVGQQFYHSIFGGNGTVTPPATTTRDQPLGAWDTTPYWTLTYTSPDSTTATDAQVVSSLVSMDLLAGAPAARPYVEVNAANANVRYDSAGAIAGKAKGTVFNEAKVTYTLRLSDPLVRNTARHIDDALHHRERTFPSSLGKTVPGEGAEPLHRLVDTTRQDSNNRVALGTCGDVWGTYNGSITGLNCDEYPFKTTVEGAAKGDGRYSARLIPAADNQKAGSLLNSTFTANRVLDGEAFYVSITA